MLLKLPTSGAVDRMKYVEIDGFDCSLGSVRSPLDARLGRNIQSCSQVLYDISQYALGGYVYTTYAAVACLPLFDASTACLPTINASVACLSMSDAPVACSSAYYAAVACVTPTYFVTSNASGYACLMQNSMLPSHQACHRNYTARSRQGCMSNVAESSCVRGNPVTLLVSTSRSGAMLSCAVCMIGISVFYN